MISKDAFEAWLTSYGKCWESGDSKGITELFSNNVRYYKTPFDEPLTGLSAIEQYWRAGAEQAQEDIRFSYSGVVVIENRGLSRWSASLIRVPSGVRVEFDGFLEAEFTTDGRCSIFREWWHKKEDA